MSKLIIEILNNAENLFKFNNDDKIYTYSLNSEKFLIWFSSFFLGKKTHLLCTYILLFFQSIPEAAKAALTKKFLDFLPFIFGACF